MALLDERPVRVVLLDIEGTTTPVNFVYKTLFPYASRKLEPFLREHWNDAEMRLQLQDLQAQHELDARQGLGPPAWQSDSDEARLRSSVAYTQWLIAKDSKSTPLKSLQGKIWQEGYGRGELRGEVYPDVPSALERWRQQGRKICIYSSGSVLAQQLLFRTTISGDLTAHITGFFDTRVGIKTDGESYKKIATSVGHSPREFLFLSDATREVEAAQAAGMQVLLCVREAHTADVPAASETIRSFDEIFPAAAL